MQEKTPDRNVVLQKKQYAVASPARKAMDHFDVEKLSSWMGDLNLGLSKLNVIALAVIVAVFGFGGVWSVTAKIGGVIAAPGRVVATGENQVVQHLEGGIIKAIYAREGDLVSKGSLLAELDVAPLDSQYYATRIQALILELELDRWRSLKNGSTELSVDLSNFGDLALDERVLATFEAQSALLVSNRQTMEHSLTEFDVSINSAEQNISSINEVITALNTQVDILSEELDGLQQLFEQGLEPRTRVLALRREVARLAASKFQAEFEVIKAQNTIVSTQQKREAAILQFGDDANENIARLQRAINSNIDLETRLVERIGRSTILSPVDGSIFKLNFQSVGSVLPPSVTFFEIVPDNAELLLESLVLAKDISQVRVGQKTDIVFASDQRKALSPIVGEVVYVSTDSVVSQTGEASYVIRSTLPVGDGQRVVVAGNVGQAFFQTEPRTLLQYVLEPLSRFVNKSFAD